MNSQFAADPDIGRVYDELTDGRRCPLRVSDLVYAAADRFPGLVPTREQMDVERKLLQKDKVGLEVNQGLFVSRVLADRDAGLHLITSMSRPTSEALRRSDELKRSDSVDLGPVRVDRDGPVGYVITQNNDFLNSEDDASVSALETAVDLVLLDDSIEVGVLRGGVAVHPKYAGRRIFGSGINLTHLYHGRISFIEFMIERELGALHKMYRGHHFADDPDQHTEKPWVAAVETFAIGGACQWLLVMDHVIAETGAYFNLPAHKEGIIPGCANLRLPRLVGERLARQAVFFNRPFTADSFEGRLIADEVVDTGNVDAAIEAAVNELLRAGMTSLVANRRALRLAAEPLDVFREYMSVYAREQVRCLYSPAMVANLERSWLSRPTVVH